MWCLGPRSTARGLVPARASQHKTALGIMSPARRFKHQAIGVDFRKARKCVGLQNATEVCQMLLRVLAVAIGAVSEPDRRRDITRGWSLIAHIRPEPGG